MIQANELRLGNWVAHEANPAMIITEIRLGYTRPLLRVSYIRTDNNQPHNSLIPDEDIEPIPLTPEILESAGFEKSEDDLGDFEFCFEDSLGNRIDKENGIYKYWYGERYAGYVELKYLHQLQNTYPVFNDWKELTINLHATV